MLNSLSPVRPMPHPPACGGVAELVDRLAIECVGLSDDEVSTLTSALDNIRGMVGARVTLRARHGDIALVDARLAARLSAAEWCARFGRRPVVAVVERGWRVHNLPTLYRISNAFHESELLDTITALAALRSSTTTSTSTTMPTTEPLPVAPTRGPTGASDFVAALLARYAVRGAQRLHAAYEDGSGLVIDFEEREVTADRRAWVQLVTRATLPRLHESAPLTTSLNSCTDRHHLDALVWAVGMACGDLPLVGAPADWRHARLAGRGWSRVYRFTRAPVHLDLVDVLLQAPMTPIELQRMTRIPEKELRAFLQACLLLGLCHWEHR
jgi:hypothetical protein